ncbi:MAG: hypothetical protein VKS61_10455 [Candidatus Sericytochromatia bacterium]|nr:hypothetical protein [Candidatus Sericytochromatia bacterium]
MMKKPNKPQEPQASGSSPAGKGPARGAARPAAATRPGKPEPLAPRFRPSLPDPGPKAAPREQIDYLAGQVQSLATRLEVLRGQGVSDAPEFRQLEQMLTVVQDRLLMAQRKLDARS